MKKKNKKITMGGLYDRRGNSGVGVCATAGIPALSLYHRGFFGFAVCATADFSGLEFVPPPIFRGWSLDHRRFFGVGRIVGVYVERNIINTEVNR